MSRQRSQMGVKISSIEIKVITEGQHGGSEYISRRTSPDSRKSALNSISRPLPRPCDKLTEDPFVLQRRIPPRSDDTTQTYDMPRNRPLGGQVTWTGSKLLVTAIFPRRHLKRVRLLDGIDTERPLALGTCLHRASTIERPLRRDRDPKTIITIQVLPTMKTKFLYQVHLTLGPRHEVSPQCLTMCTKINDWVITCITQALCIQRSDTFRLMTASAVF